MRIGIDARFYGSIGKGLGRYTSELIRHLEEIDDENEYVVFLRRDNFDEYRPQNPLFSKVLAEFPWYSWKEQLILPLWLSRHKLDLVHFLHFNVPYFYRKPFIVTIHDLILLRFPTPRATTLGPLFFRIKFFFYRLVIERAISASKTVITVSEYTKKDIVESFPEAAQKPIIVTYEACSPELLPETPGDGSGPEDKRILSLPVPFMLYVGNAYPHKNLERLLDAFQQFRDDGYEDYHLILVGGRDYFYDRLKDESAAKGVGDNVVFFGHATDGELGRIYDRAAFYVFPSLCEGFGLPPLEAMCRGLPVASSNATCLPEVLERAALFFDPEDTGSMADAMRRMAADDALRDELSVKGKAHSAGFSWKRLARETKDVYDQTLKGND